MTGMILIDLQKAFDTIDHDVLLQKLCAIGFSKHTVNWFLLDSYFQQIYLVPFLNNKNLKELLAPSKYPNLRTVDKIPVLTLTNVIFAKITWYLTELSIIRYWFRKTYCYWLKFYLSNISFLVNLRNNFSQPTSVSCGVPQGSILGPILFLICVNDMSQSAKCHLLLYADDSCLACQNKDIKKS